MSPIDAIHSSGMPDRPEDRRLSQAVQQLEGVFVEQLFKAMRETVPHEGVMGGGAGEEMFTGLLDQRMSEVVPAQWESGLGEALLKRFRAASPALPDVATTVPPGGPTR